MIFTEILKSPNRFLFDSRLSRTCVCVRKRSPDKMGVGNLNLTPRRVLVRRVQYHTFHRMWLKTYGNCRNPWKIHALDWFWLPRQFISPPSPPWEVEQAARATSGAASVAPDGLLQVSACPQCPMWCLGWSSIDNTTNTGQWQHFLEFLKKSTNKIYIKKRHAYIII